MEKNYDKWFESHFDRLYKPLYRHLRIRIGSGKLPLIHEIDDLINDVFLIMWKKRRSFYDHPNLDALMYVIAEQCLISRIRKLPRQVYNDWLLDDQAVDEYVRHELVQLKLANVAEVLGEDRMQMLIDYFDPSHRPADMAKSMGLKPNTLAVRMYGYIKRARNVLKIYLLQISLFLLLNR